MKARAKGRPPRKEEPDAQLSVMLPASIVRAIKIRAAERGETLRATVLRALKANGFRVAESHIVDRRAEANRRRGLRSEP